MAHLFDAVPVLTHVYLAGSVLAGSVWSVYGQVAAAAAVWLGYGGLGRSMVGFVSVGSVALRLYVVCGARSLLPTLVERVLVCPIAV